jgi:heme A synthase
MKQTDPPRGFHFLSWLALIDGVLLIWMGAAVTTTGAGMAFSDWPLSSGSINPPGWLYIQPQFLEHGHRLLATTVGFLVLGMFLWQWFRAKLNFFTPVVLIFAFIFLIPAVHAADAMSKGAESKLVTLASQYVSGPAVLWTLSGVTWGAVLCWLIWNLCGTRWSALLKLSAAALIVVVFQAILGGLRVLEVSDPFGVAHGCLGQLFYCLLIAITLVSSKWWQRGELVFPIKEHRLLVKLSSLLFASISMQLLLGAIVRHTQRAGLAATDVLTTGGHVIPPTDPFDVFTIFMHKSWAMVVFALAMVTAVWAAKILKESGWTRVLPRLLLLLPPIQIGLGIYVVLTAKKFWVTNIHVLNGLAILASAFLLMVIAWRSRGSLGVVAK